MTEGQFLFNVILIFIFRCYPIPHTVCDNYVDDNNSFIKWDIVKQKLAYDVQDW